MADNKKSKSNFELHGKVKDTKFLRLREQPSLESKCLMILSSEELLIDKKSANNKSEEFYKVCVLGESNKVCAEGYVMKKFVETFKVDVAPVEEHNEELPPVEEAAQSEEVKESEGE